MKKKTIALLFAACLLAAGLLSGCASAQASSGFTTALSDIKESGKITVGCDPALENILFENPANGVLEGFIPDMIQDWAATMEVEVEWVPLEWSAMITALETGKVDMVAADMNRTVARASSITFCDPWLVDTSMACVMNDSPYKTFADLNEPGVKFGVVSGSVYETLTNEIFPDAEVVTIPMGSWLDSMQTGVVDANLQGGIQIGVLMKTAGDKMRLLMPEEGESPTMRYAFAVKQGDTPLAECFNVYLSEAKFEGTYGEMHEKWLGYEWNPTSTGIDY